MIVKWLDFSDLHFEYTNVDTVNIRDNLLSTISDKELDADFILMCGDLVRRAPRPWRRALRPPRRRGRIRCGPAGWG